jgi:penicillin-binding protein 2
MLNQPLNSALDSGFEETIELGSTARFRYLLTGFCLAVAVIVWRIGWVQSQLQAVYLDVLNVTTTEYELIPARDGRILADSAVLAADEDLYSVEVHYRWLEEPANEQWIWRHVRSVLTREERLDDELSARVRESRLRQRNELWQHLSETLSVTDESLNPTRRRIQKRVEGIAADVDRRQQDRLKRQTVSSDVTDPFGVPNDDSDNVLLKMARRFRRAITTTPRRRSDDRIVVREEEDYHVILSDVNLKIAAEIQSHPERFPGTRINLATRRTYPQKSLGSHVIGARTALREDERQQLDSETRQALSNWVPRRGRSGVEYSWDHRLKATGGLRKTVRNRRQQIVESSIVRNPAAGRDVVLTMHVHLQQHAERLLAEALNDVPRALLPIPEESDAGPDPVPSGGSVLMMDVQTGRLLTAASAPGFDLSLFISGTTEDWAAVNADSRQPFLSRITGMALPPGSAFKPLTAVAALESGTVRPDESIYCRGYLDNPDEHRCLIFRLYGTGHQDITLHRALAQSCNVYFFHVAREMGIVPLSEWCGRFGFGAPTGVDLPFEKPGTLPRRPPQEASQTVRRRYERETLGLAIGQSRLTTTPLQIIRMMAAIANGGWLVVPHIVSPDGVARNADEMDDSPRDLSRRRISGLRTETLTAVREGLNEAVEQPYGTGYRTVRLSGVTIAGKSGTAETSPGKPDHAWFTGYVPADAPRYAFVVVLEHGGSGSRAAGPVARELIRFMVDEQLIGD